MSESYCPRLSEARDLLPLLRAHLAAAASRHALPGAVSLDLLPIVDDGLFGYELAPERPTRVWLTLGCNGNGVPMLRTTWCGPVAPHRLRLATVDGREVARHVPGARRDQRRESLFPDWPSAAAAAWAQLAAPSPARRGRLVVPDESAHRLLDAALSTAYSYLAAWDPFIRFFGLPNEAQHGFVLHGAAGEHGELVAQRPDIWILRWKAPPHAVYEEWSVVLPDRDAATEPTRA
jgi:hypothetical protein